MALLEMQLTKCHAQVCEPNKNRVIETQFTEHQYITDDGVFHNKVYLFHRF